MKRTWLIKGGRILDPATGRDEVGDVAVVDGRIVADIPATSEVSVFDATGMWVLPGFLDLHAHFRVPGAAESETWETGAAAAVRGGFTRVVLMPNTTPAIDTVDWVEAIAAFSQGCPVDLLPAACCTAGRAGKAVAELRALRKAGAVAFTDDGAMVADDAVMEEVMTLAAELGAVVMDHAVVPSIAGGGVVRECEATRRLGVPFFPKEAEICAVERDIRLARKTGCRLHLQHLSCAESVALLRQAHEEGFKESITAEATPHHLLLSAEDVPDTNDAVNWKMNPPLGVRSDVEALRQGVKDGTIACCATDHAPHAKALKDVGLLRAAFGVIGLETAVGASMKALIEEAGMTPLGWGALWTLRPAQILGIPSPTLAAGSVADVCIVNPVPWDYKEKDIVSKSHNSPFIGRTLFGDVVATMKRGEFVGRQY